MTISSTERYLHDIGESDGRALGLREGSARQLGKLLLRHGKKRWGEAVPDQKELINSLMDRSGQAELEQIVERFLDVNGWVELLAGVTLPESPTAPDYVLPPDFELYVESPAIDHYVDVSPKQGGEHAIFHFRLQKLYQPELGQILYEQNREFEKQKGQPVQFAAVVLLWPGADGKGCTGEYRIPNGGVYRYQISRMWEKDVEEALKSPGMAIFAPLAKFEPERLPSIVTRIQELIESEDTGVDRNMMWHLVYWTMGLRFTAAEVNSSLGPILPRILAMESTKSTRSHAYQMGYGKGQYEGSLQGTRHWILRLGERRLGKPQATLRDAIASLTSTSRLEQLSARVLKENDWVSVTKPD